MNQRYVLRTGHSTSCNRQRVYIELLILKMVSSAIIPQYYREYHDNVFERCVISYVTISNNRLIDVPKYHMRFCIYIFHCINYRVR